jgi:hypothetical protein
VTGLIVTSDGKYVLAADRQGKSLLYPIRGGEPRPLSVVLEPDHFAVQFEPDGKSLIVANQGVPARIIRRFLDNRPEQILAWLLLLTRLAFWKYELCT